MDPLMSVGDFLTFIGSQTQRLVSNVSKFENENSKSFSEMNSDTDIIALLIVVPRKIIKTGK